MTATTERDGATARPDGAVAMMQNANYMQTICDVCKEPMPLNYDEACPRKHDTMWCHRKCLKPEEQGTAPILEAAKAAVSSHDALVEKVRALIADLRAPGPFNPIPASEYHIITRQIQIQVQMAEVTLKQKIADELLRALGDGR